MGNVDDLRPETTQTVEAIYKAWEERAAKEKRRGYLGASYLGHHCNRALWYGFRWCGREKFDGRMYRLFDRGHREEPRMVEELKWLGVEVHEVDQRTGEQFEVVFAKGHGAGHLDGVALGVLEAPKTWHVLEFKTFGTRSFAKLKKGKVKKAQPKHYTQMQIYMVKTGITRALYMAVCKETDELYTERIELDTEFAEKQLRRAEQIAFADRPPEGAGTSPSDDNCKYCPFINLCFGNPQGPAVPCGVNCRTCVISKPIEDGKWMCTDREKVLSLEDQERGCPQHLFITQLVSFAVPVNVGKDEYGHYAVEYMNEDNSSWVNGPSDCPEGHNGNWTSLELTKVPMAEVQANGSFVSKVREAVDGTVTDMEAPGDGKEFLNG